MTFHDFCDAVRTYGFLTRASVTSWGRTWGRQTLLDPDVQHSPHVYWVGCDVVYDGQPPANRDDVAARLGLKLIAENDHDHLQPLEWRAG